MKQRILGYINGFTLKVMAGPRKMYHRWKARKCNVNKCCIICNNCTGGVILHDLGLKFDTPTINTLFHSAEDFLFFVTNIKSFSESEVIRISNSKYSYPVGGIKLGNREIKVGFVHYSTFEEAKSKWFERFKRVDFEKIMVLWEGKGLEEKDLKVLDTISFKKLVLSASNKSYSDRYPFYLGSNIYEKWFPGKVLGYKHSFALKRYLDDFDYISVINI